METIQAILLAIIQGLTEFLPISSSAHLILLSEISGWEDQGLAFDVALHFGTLLAVLLYFRNDLFNMFTRSNFQNADAFTHSQLSPSPITSPIATPIPIKILPTTWPTARLPLLNSSPVLNGVKRSSHL